VNTIDRSISQKRNKDPKSLTVEGLDLDMDMDMDMDMGQRKNDDPFKPIFSTPPQRHRLFSEVKRNRLLISKRTNRKSNTQQHPHDFLRPSVLPSFLLADFGIWILFYFDFFVWIFFLFLF
jgi:hypothetical protein